jgi:hypothetical protein
LRRQAFRFVELSARETRVRAELVFQVGQSEKQRRDQVRVAELMRLCEGALPERSCLGVINAHAHLAERAQGTQAKHRLYVGIPT